MKKWWMIVLLALLPLLAAGAQADAVIVLLPDGSAEIEGTGAQAQENVLTISQGGAYTLSGAWTQGQVVVNAGKNDLVTISLDGVEMINDSAAALYVEQAQRVTLLLMQDTQSRIVSGEQIDVTNAEPDESATGGAVHVRAGLVIDGEGALFVGGYLNNGIHCTDMLTLSGGKLTVEAKNDGLKGKDGVVIDAGELTVTASGDAVQSEDDLVVNGGVVHLITGSGRQTAAENMQDFSPERFSLTEGTAPDAPAPGSERFEMPMPEGNGMPATEFSSQPTPAGQGRQGAAERNSGARTNGMNGKNGGMGGMPWETAGTDSGISRKGLKAAAGLYVNGGRLLIDTQDDALHAGTEIVICGGEMTLYSDDDGIHADERVEIRDGSVTVANSYEGIEAPQICVSGGSVQVTATDDGMNASDGSGSGGIMRGWLTQMNTNSGTLPTLLISGGNVYVNAQGDGLDSNGDLLITGGYVIVEGPTNSGNGALDCGTESGGVCRVSGGTVLAMGAAGMAESFDAGSEQCSFMTTMNVSAGQELIILDETGRELMRWTPQKSAQSVVFSCGELALGHTYTLSSGSVTQTVEQTSTSSGGQGGFFMRRGW